MSMNSESRIYLKREFVGILNKATYSILKYGKYKRMINKEFETNIMLAVTEVNGCQACNYFHTKHAIESGISDEELKSLLSGDHLNVKKEEAMALMFAQHYASEKEQYSEESFEKVKEHYSKEEAYGILTVIRLISFGNAHGINTGNLKSRFTKKGKVKDSKLFNELFIILSPIVLLPVFLIINLFKRKKFV